MKAAARVLLKDLFEFLQSPQSVAFVLVLPPIVVLLVGQLRPQPPAFKLLMAGDVPEYDQRAREQLRDAERMVRGIGILEVTREPTAVADPLDAFRKRGFDLLLNVQGRGSDRWWTLYTAETDRARIGGLQQIVNGLGRALTVIETRDVGVEPAAISAPPQAAPPDTSDSARSESKRLLKDLVVAGALPSPLFSYFPAASRRSGSLLPGTIALLLCFLPFAVATPSINREKDARTLDILLSSPGVTPRALFGGKCLLPIVVTLFDLLLVLVLIDAFYPLYAKGHWLLVLSVVIPALLSTVFLGLIVSSLATSPAQTTLASGTYFLAICLFSGFLYPLSEASAIVRVIASLFPMTFVNTAIGSWLFGASPLLKMPLIPLVLWAQCLAYGALSIRTFELSMKRL